MGGSKKLSSRAKAALMRGRLSAESGPADHLPEMYSRCTPGRVVAWEPWRLLISHLKPAERMGGGFLLVSHQVRSKSPSPKATLSVPSLLLSQVFAPAAPGLRMPRPHSLC